MSVRQRFNPADIDSRFRSWIAGLLASDLTDPLAAEEMETQVLAYLAQQLKGDHSSVPFDANRTPHTADPYISRALDYIHGHYTSRMTIDQLASEALQSRYHFIRMFKRETKLTPYQYVIGLRIGEAKRRLAQTRETVTEISYSLGFASTSQFHRAFLKAVGLTPEQFRKG